MIGPSGVRVNFAGQERIRLRLFLDARLFENRTLSGYTEPAPYASELLRQPRLDQHGIRRVSRFNPVLDGKMLSGNRAAPDFVGPFAPADDLASGSRRIFFSSPA
jgi:hypothetical protein